MAWTPEYPGQEREPLWVWWTPGESEEGMTGFHTKEDLDAFSNNEPGPFRRRLTVPGRPDISQMEGWDGMMDRICQAVGIERNK